MRQHCRGDERRVLELDAVMDLVALAQSAQDADRVLHRRLTDDHRLKPPFERRVLFDVLAVLVQRRRPDVCSSPRASIASTIFELIAPSPRRADHRGTLFDER